MFYLAAQANLVYLELDEGQAAGGLELGILNPGFTFAGLKSVSKSGAVPWNPWKIVAKACSRVFLLSLASFGAALVGKAVRAGL